MALSSSVDFLTWADRVVGSPYQALGRGDPGFDCLGLVLVAYREVLGVELPDPMREDDYTVPGLRVLSERFHQVEGALLPMDVLHVREGRPHLALVEDAEWILHATEAQVVRSPLAGVTARVRCDAYRLGARR